MAVISVAGGAGWVCVALARAFGDSAPFWFRGEEVEIEVGAIVVLEIIDAGEGCGVECFAEG